MSTPMSNDQIWQAVLGELELHISKASFTTWFAHTSIGLFENEKVVVCVPNTFTKTWLEKKYHKHILSSLQNITQRRIREISYQIVQNSPQKIQKQVPEKQKTVLTPIQNSPQKIQKNSSPFNLKYLFNSFVVGKTNELAYAACKAITEKPGEAYNPLFIYGGVGLGKTHLLQAIANTMVQKGTAIERIRYVSSEKFTNEYIQTVQSGEARGFKDRYRNIDILLIDDVQFFSGKERTQEEFFHTFNHLHQQNKQIVLTSDRSPKEIKALENRLLSRFEWGMIVDIAAPDLETRIAIFEKKCEEKGFFLDKDIITLVAENITTNIRELEGVLNRIIANHQLRKQKPTKESVEEIIMSIKPRKTRGSVAPKTIISAVGDYFEVSLSDLLGKSREQKISFPRQIIMFLLREELGHSFPAIGNELGGRDHTTALHAHTKIKNEITKNEKLKNDIELLKEKIYQI